MRMSTDMTGSFVSSPFDYAMSLVRRGFTAAEYQEQAAGTQPSEYVEAVLFEFSQLPTIQHLYS
ncbi:hypothetical protein A3709_19335 [Halioglobus sp. HI00S01]|uniref:hypothetical protein n=1 Tax=Halioglobus sp. HI00S01 TaxID=1822214 RepID=UPI0007C24F35|nr:hypothetical protein [Halioglobus sp. HI00S01]KZX57778.1 hypothetical protein A3709_19335 [Halioglobus sp. HI00S01]